MAVALVVAAGRGERLGLGVPKAFTALAGRAMLDWSLDALREVAAIERIVVALPKDTRAPEGTVGVPGGASRSASVAAALRAAGPAASVLVHDAARPLVTPQLIAAVLDGLTDGVDAAIAAAPVTDTIKRASADGRVSETLERSALWAVQTPQAFARAALEHALAADPDTLAAATDDAWLVERAGGEVRVVPAPAENLKVTTAADLALAEMLLASRSGARSRDLGVSTPTGVSLRILASDELDLLEPLWLALHAHHERVTPAVADRPRRARADSWLRRRARYERWMRAPGSFAVLAERTAAPVGYAFVTIVPGHASWASGDRIAALETISVIEAERGRGVGRALLEAVMGELERDGVHEITVTTTETNLPAHRFYERVGLAHAFRVYYGRPTLD